MVVSRGTGRPVLFTVDTEPDWGLKGDRAVGEMLPRLLDLLRRRNMRATFFVAANLLDTRRDVLAAIGPDHEIGSHGLTHRRFDRMAPEEWRFELAESRRRLEDELGRTVRGVRAPFFGRPEGWLAEVRAAGYAWDASAGCVRPGLRNRREARDHHGGAAPQLGVSTFRDGLTPFCLTYLRLYAPFSFLLLPRAPRMFYLHLHEFLPPETAGDVAPLIRLLLTRNCGERAWKILEGALDRIDGRWITCSEYIRGGFLVG